MSTPPRPRKANSTRRPTVYRGPAGPLGCHVSIAGGIHRAPERGRELGAAAIQIFVRSPRSWRFPPVDPADAAQFLHEQQRHGVTAVVAHAMYLANLGSADPAVWRRSVEVLTDEVERCAQLGIGRIVTHPGSAGTATPEEGLKRIRAGLVEVAQRTAGRPVVILLEMMAGTGAQAGRSLEQLAWLIDRHPNPERLGLCLDTAHAFASGYPLHEPDGLAQLLDEIERRVGLNKLGCLHLNDSLKPFASRVDRHARIGHGELGRAFFARVLAESRLFGVPKILEVPGGDIAFREDLRLLARLARAASAGRQ